AGADMLGFNFYRRSPRFIEPGNARAIIEELRPAGTSKRKVIMSGVFVSEPSPESVLGLANEAGVEAVQLHGDESLAFCRNLKVLLKERFLIKALNAGDDFELERGTACEVDAIMLDAFHSELRGGTGRLVDWSVARRAREAVPR